MRKIDEDFFRQNFYMIQGVLSGFNIAECFVNFTDDPFGTLTMYLAFEPFDNKIFDDVEGAFNDIFSHANVQYINLFFLGQRQEPNLPTINFFTLNPELARVSTPVRAATRSPSPARDGVFSTPKQHAYVDAGRKRTAEQTPEQDSQDGLSFYGKRSSTASQLDVRASVRKRLFGGTP